MRSESGFTLIEIMITMAIVGLLAVIAIPFYQNYSKRAVYTEVVAAIAPARIAIESCFQEVQQLENCDTAAKVGYTLPTGNILGAVNTLRITTSTASVVAVPNAYKGISSADTCTLTPRISDSTLIWSYSGPCVDLGYIKP